MPTEPEWRRKLPDMADLPDEVAMIFDGHARVLKFARGARLFRLRQPLDTLCLPVVGTVRVQQIAAKRSPVVLFRLNGSECTALNMIRQLSCRTPDLEAVAETDTEVLLVPRQTFDAITSVSRDFRARSFDACAKCIDTLIVMIEDAALAQFSGNERPEAQKMRPPDPGIHRDDRFRLH